MNFDVTKLDVEVAPPLVGGWLVDGGLSTFLPGSGAPEAQPDLASGGGSRQETP